MGKGCVELAEHCPCYCSEGVFGRSLIVATEEICVQRRIIIAVIFSQGYS
jgi:hypothetical protein